MADTQRLVATLQGLLPSTGTGDIDAQDLRDFLVSAQPGFGQLYITSSAATTISAANTYYSAAGTWALGGTAQKFSRGADNQLRYDGVPTYYGLIVASFAITSASSSQACRVALAKNGTILNGGDVSVYLGTTGSAPGMGCVVAITSLATNDYLGIYLRNDTGANNLTLAYASINIISGMA